MDLVKKGALLHDLGNIVKFKFEHLPNLIEEGKEQYWREVQKEFAAKYGVDTHEATRKIAQEVGVTGKLLDDILLSDWENLSGSLERAIVIYADSRVGPFGIVSLEERLKDLRKRYGASVINALVHAARKRERIVQKNLDIPVSEITDESIKGSDEELLITEI